MNDFHLSSSQKMQYSNLLERIAEALDITRTQFEEARSRYEAIGKWLDADNSPLKPYNPEIAPQGSFRLGTVIKPLTDEEQYDVDLICILYIKPAIISQYQLKKMIGDRLKESDVYRKMLEEEKKRCWTLMYAEATRFHMDLLPALFDEGCEILISLGVPREYAEKALVITDKEHLQYYDYHADWPKSNPLGYAEWFKDSMKIQLAERKKSYAIEIRASVEEIQDYEVKTPLQRVIQLFKRHRDVMFGDDEDKPISIIITTLATQAYDNEENIFDALSNILDKMPAFILTTPSGKKVIPNPVDPRENFADRWTPTKERNFYAWLMKAKQDLVILNKKLGFVEIGNDLKTSLGDKVVTKALNSLGTQMREQRENGNLFVQPGVAQITSDSTKGKVIPNHTFHGKI